MAKYLVFAASSGIGRSVVAELREAGHTVLTTARNTNKIEPDFVMDAADFDAVDGVFEKASKIGWLPEGSYGAARQVAGATFLLAQIT